MRCAKRISQERQEYETNHPVQRKEPPRFQRSRVARKAPRSPRRITAFKLRQSRTAAAVASVLAGHRFVRSARIILRMKRPAVSRVRRRCSRDRDDSGSADSEQRERAWCIWSVRSERSKTESITKCQKARKQEWIRLLCGRLGLPQLPQPWMSRARMSPNKNANAGS